MATVRLLQAGELAQLLGISLRQLRRLRARRELPAPLVLGDRTLRWRLTDVERWLAQRATQQPDVVA